jgi:hypothetical protein
MVTKVDHIELVVHRFDEYDATRATPDPAATQ